VAAGDAAKLKGELAAAVKQIAKAASKGVIHKGQAARRISRLTRAANAPAAKQ
jgi:small subunit ribosomal protein S20